MKKLLLLLFPISVFAQDTIFVPIKGPNGAYQQSSPGVDALALKTDLTLFRNLRVFNVLDFGATGNGVTDDYAAIRRAADSALKYQAKLYFPAPASRYRFTQTRRRKTARHIILRWRARHCCSENKRPKILED